MKSFLILACSAILLCACGVAAPEPTVTVSPNPTATATATETIIPTITASSTWTLAPSNTPTITLTPTATYIPAVIYPAETFAGWKTIEHDNYSLKVPPSFYIPANTDPVFILVDSKATFDGWNQGRSFEGKLIIQMMAWVNDRRIDPFDPNSGLASREEALQRTVNMTIGLSHYVDGSTDVPWINANGGTYDGRKNWVETIPYVNVILGEVKAVRFLSPEGSIYYFILSPQGDDRLVRVNIQPGDSKMLPVADQILSTFTFVK